MKKIFLLFAFCLVISTVCLINSCTKENAGYSYTPLPPPPPDTTAVTASYTEEFADVPLLTTKGWAIGEYSQADTFGTTSWIQGDFGSILKGDTTFYGFSAYSTTGSVFEYIYSYDPWTDSSLSISSWLLTPVLSVKNGDKISFYTRGDTTGVFTDRMQVLLNKKASLYIGHDLNSVGDFTTVLDDINPSQTPGGYPTSWTKYEYVLSGLSGQMNIRIAFRHYVINPKNARGIGIDQFKFEVN
jgi:hypothetical protein